ncbi:hypothetical protein H0H92_003609 [Tricholoma furcatifolium]|nr:hypothetical protein H0H92_003609 [Tricholoma furcatifolium]
MAFTGDTPSAPTSEDEFDAYCDNWTEEELNVMYDLEYDPSRELPSHVTPAFNSSPEPGSKESKTTTVSSPSTDASGAQNPPKRGRGRPKGSRNRPAATISSSTAIGHKRPVGRPRGSGPRQKMLAMKSSKGIKGLKVPGVPLTGPSY